MITVVLNRQHDIRYTLKSVTNQTYSNVEFIVIDGGSSDGTVAIIEEYLSRISTFVSEKDNGIYDAMNKGLSKATGDYVLFINGGDALHDDFVFQKIQEQYFNNNTFPDILYGECMFVNSKREEIGLRSHVRRNPLPEKLVKSSFLYGSNVTHQCFIIKRTLAEPYNTQYKLSSDLDWMLKGISKSKLSINTGLVIADFVLGDASQQYYWQSMKERFIIWCKHYGYLKSFIAHVFIVFNSIFKNK